MKSLQRMTETKEDKGENILLICKLALTYEATATICGVKKHNMVLIYWENGNYIQKELIIAS